jgi:hypothetical protein
MNESPKRGGSRGRGIALEVVAWLAFVDIVVSKVVAPLVGLTNATKPPRGTFWDQIGGSGHMEVELTRAGVEAAVGGGAVLPVDGSVSLGEVTLTPAVSAQITFPRLGWADLLATVGADLIAGLTGAVVCFILWRVARTVRQGAPFEAMNATRLSAAGIICLAGGALHVAVNALGQYVVSTRGALDGLVNVHLAGQLGWVALGVVLVALGQVFRRGVSLEADTEGLV